ncbi:helix-turn-helix domain-containing protein [Rhodovibrionaceae bacterium A322]
MLVEEVESIGGRITQAREAQSLSVAQSARRLGVKSVTWSNWENDRSTPRANKLHMLSGALGVSPLWLLTGEGNGPVDTNSDEIHLLRQEMEAVTAEAAALQTRLQEICTRLAFLDR